MYMAHNGQSPTYISDTLTPVSRGPARGRLRSADTTDYLVPRTRSKLEERTFCVSGPLVWNSLPESLLIVSQLFVAGLRLTFLTSTYRDFIFTLLVFCIVDICTARPTRVVVGLALQCVQKKVSPSNILHWQVQTCPVLNKIKHALAQKYLSYCRQILYDSIIPFNRFSIFTNCCHRFQLPTWLAYYARRTSRTSRMMSCCR